MTENNQLSAMRMNKILADKLDDYETTGQMCPRCNAVNDCHALETRSIGEDGIKRRRHECTKCNARWQTYEISENSLKDLFDTLPSDESIVLGPDLVAALKQLVTEVLE